MAATQAESQLNETNREHLHENSSEISNNTIQNGTEKNGARSVNVVSDTSSKNKYPPHNYNVDMSHFRPEANIGQPMQHEQNDELNAKHNSEKGYLQNIDNGGNEVNYAKGLPESAAVGSHVQNYNLPFSPRNNFTHPEHSPNPVQMNSADNSAGTNCNSNNNNNVHQNSISNQFGNMRHPFPNSKPIPGAVRPVGPHLNTHSGNFNPHSPQRFPMSGQSISQQMGPTPTLNQLLQSSNPVHRYQNSNYEYNNQKPNETPHGASYNHGWNTRPMAPYVNQTPMSYRNQIPNAPVRCSTVGVPPGSGGPSYSQQPPPGSSVSGPPTSSYPPHPQPPSSPSHQQQQPPVASQQYQPYPQRYPVAPNVTAGPPQQSSPVRVPAYPAPPHHQMGSPFGPMGQGPNMQSGGSPYPGDQRLPWPSMHAQQQPPPMPLQQQQQPPPQVATSQQSQQPPQNMSQHTTANMNQSPSHNPASLQQQSQATQPPSQSPHLPPNSPVPPAPSTPTPHSGSTTSQQHSPQSAIPSPQSAHPEPSPQQTHQAQQSPQQSTQSYGGNSRSNLRSTTPEPGDLASQNSNDSSSGGGPQAMRPTPSPTGSTGSRSMSPAIGQQNIPMPPRPSSGQSDSGSTSSQSRMSHSPMNPNQGTYQQQPLAPPPHMQNYKMGSSGPQAPLHPGGMISNPSSGAPYSQMPPSHQPFNQQGAYSSRGIQNMQAYHQNYGLQQPGGSGHSQYPSRPMPNHVQHSQFPGFQGWPSPNVSVSNSSSSPMPMGGPGAPVNHVPSQGSGKGIPPPTSSPQQSPSAQLSPGPPHQQIPSSMPSGQHHPMHHMHPPHQQPPQQQQSPVQSQQPPQQQPSPQCQPPQSSPQMGQNCSPGSRSHTPPQYLKHHLQHKVGFSSSSSNMPPSPGPPPGMYGGSSSPGMGPPHHHPMGPPIPGGHHHMGTSNLNHPMSNMMPPHGNSHHDSPMPPPSSTPNSHSLPTQSIQSDSSMEGGMHDGGGLNTMATGNMTNVSQMNSGAIMSVITTGPDGAPIDEASQHSTLSNTSAASGEDPSSTPKRKESGLGMMGSMGGYLGHGHSQGPVPPCSPNMNSVHDDYSSEGNQAWNRTPSSPVFNSHMPQEMYRSKKNDSIGKLYEMDDNPERKVWLDKFLHFMEERGTPVPQCPTISKNPIDLFRLYVYVKERGGFLEVTKNKIWKDIAGLLGFGASSSAAYTLKKNYLKTLLPFECHFDRGGIDPQPIISQVESSSKKKSAKAASVPSPGSSNSQDSFPSGQATSGPNMESYGYGYGGGAGGDYGNQRGPPSMPNSQGMPSQPGGYQNQPGYNQYPSDQYGQQYMGNNSYPPSRPMYPGYPPDADRSYNQNSSMGPGIGPQQSAPSPTAPGPATVDPYSRSPYSQPMYHSRPPFSGPGQTQQPAQGVNSSQPSSTHVIPSPPRPDSQSSPSPYPPSPQQQQPPPQPPPSVAQQQSPMPPSSQTMQSSISPHLPSQPPQGPAHQQTSPLPPNQQMPQQQPPAPSISNPSPQQPISSQVPPSPSPHDFYRPDQPFPNQNAMPTSVNNSYPPTGPSKGMPPPIQQPRRHPDFSKESQQSPPPNTYAPYPNQPQQRPMFAGWPNDNSNRHQYPRGPYPGSQGGVPANPAQQWSQPQMQRLPTSNAQPPNSQWDRYPPNSPQQPFPPQSGQWNVSNSNTIAQNSNLRPPRPSYRTDKPFPLMPPTQTVKSAPPNQIAPQPTYGPSPVLKRELVFPPDSVEAVAPLLYKRKRLTKNDVAPVDAWKLMMSLRSGLLTETCWALDVLNILLFDETGVQYFGLTHLPGLLDILLEHFIRSLDDMLESSYDNGNRRWYEKPVHEVKEPDLGRVIEPIDPKDRLPFRTNLPDYTMKSRRGKPVTTIDGSEDLFIRDGPREWEGRDMQIEDVVEPDPRYIVPCFRSEFGIVPFVRLMPEAKNYVRRRRSGIDTNSDTNHRTRDDNCYELVTIKTEKDSVTCKVAGVSANNRDTNGSIIIKSEPCDDDQSSSAITVKSENVSEDIATKSENLNRHRGRRKPLENGDSTTKEEQDENDNKTKSEEIDEKVEDNEKKDAGTCDNSNVETIDVLKKRKLSMYEDECYTRDEASLYLITDTQDAIARRCICISTILRNLTFIPGNEYEFSKNPAYLALMGKLLLVHHEHPLRTQKQKNYDREDDTDFSDCCSSLQGESEWWWDFLHQIRENVLVSIANISGYIDLSNYLEDVSRPILDGLLHWAVCPAAQGQDPFPTASTLSPQKLALEALCKLCVTDANVDLVIATPPYSRLEKLCSVLTKLLCKSEEQVLREFAINLLHYLAAADTSMSRIIALQSPCISLLVAFIEQAEQSALGVANQHGINALRDNPESMGTSLDMLRRAARTLLHLSKHPDNKPLFLQQEQRLLALVMSQILDQQVAGIISQVLYQCSRASSPALTKS